MARFPQAGGTRSGGNAGKGSPKVITNSPKGGKSGGIQPQKQSAKASPVIARKVMSVRTNSVNPQQGPSSKGTQPRSSPGPMRTPLGMKPGGKSSQPMGGGKYTPKGTSGPGGGVTLGDKVGKGLGKPPRSSRIGNKS